jgi:hypothetical protein
VVFQVGLNSFDSRIDCDDICNSKLDASNHRSWNLSSACRFLLGFDKHRGRTPVLPAA